MEAIKKGDDLICINPKTFSLTKGKVYKAVSDSYTFSFMFGERIIVDVVDDFNYVVGYDVDCFAFQMSLMEKEVGSMTMELKINGVQELSNKLHRLSGILKNVETNLQEAMKICDEIGENELDVTTSFPNGNEKR